MSAASLAIAGVREQVKPEEWAIRQDLAAAYRLVAQFGWDDLIFTHLSARIPGPEHHFLINPYGLLFDEITASNLVKIDLDGQPVIDTPYGTNAAGFTIHGAIHEARDDAQCVMHLHTLDGSAVATMEEGLMPLNQTTMLIREDVAYHEYEGVALNLDERTRLVADLGEKNLMMLWNHGTLSLGRNVGEAFARMYLLERACSMQVRGLSGGSGLHMPSAEAIATTAAQGRAAMDMGVGDLLWPALLRRLDKTDASFRD